MSRKRSIPSQSEPMVDKDGRITLPWLIFFQELLLLDETYFGKQAENGSWRIVKSGTDLSFQRLELGTWVEKGSFAA